MHPVLHNLLDNQKMQIVPPLPSDDRTQKVLLWIYGRFPMKSKEMERRVVRCVVHHLGCAAPANTAVCEAHTKTVPASYLRRLVALCLAQILPWKPLVAMEKCCS